ncbi:MAG: 16S rRNA (cytosine(1402)-N(4))-methyltransferase RsmH, partial [Alphaproteobacteria bacterium]|nr:16S rRNA (cytosine(1402)-N(4))-methyltransferase RsmH [Alphaproteobacteria bacterium]
RRFLDAGASVHAFDRDPDAISAARADPARWPELASDPPRLVLLPRRFSEMVEAMAEQGIARVDGIAMDVGISSMQLDQPARGFAFAAEGPLDMRMAQEGPSAGDFVNTAPEAEIAQVLSRYGEERQSRRLARAIMAARPLSTTTELATVVRKALGHRPGTPKDPATRSFQAIRIHVNGELEELETALAAAERLLAAGGKLAVVSFHSLEDRIVKRFLREANGMGQATSRHLPQAAPAFVPTFSRIARALRAGEAEVARNPRARSATLRAATRTEAPPRRSIAV